MDGTLNLGVCLGCYLSSSSSTTAAMLPAPVSSRTRGTYASPLTGKHRHYGNNSSSSSAFGAWADQQLPPHWSSALNTLAQRSRATNLAVCLLLLAASVSLLVNIRLYFGDQVTLSFSIYHQQNKANPDHLATGLQAPAARRQPHLYVAGQVYTELSDIIRSLGRRAWTRDMEWPRSRQACSR